MDKSLAVLDNCISVWPAGHDSVAVGRVTEFVTLKVGAVMETLASRVLAWMSPSLTTTSSRFIEPAPALIVRPLEDAMFAVDRESTVSPPVTVVGLFMATCPSDSTIWAAFRIEPGLDSKWTSFTDEITKSPTLVPTQFAPGTVTMRRRPSCDITYTSLQKICYRQIGEIGRLANTKSAR